MRVNQRPGHPGADQPAAVADNCNGPTVASLLLHLLLNTGDPFGRYSLRRGGGLLRPQRQTRLPAGLAQPALHRSQPGYSVHDPFSEHG